MSTLAIIVIVIVAVIVIAVVAALMKRARDRKLDDRRQIAAQHREESTSRRLAAEKESAAADEPAELPDRSQERSRRPRGPGRRRADLTSRGLAPGRAAKLGSALRFVAKFATFQPTPRG